MPTNNILISKIVASPTESAYAQVYSTLNLYIVISLLDETHSTPVTQQGKDILEKLQREYFALDSKSLEDIKKAVENSLDSESKAQISIILGTVTENILYLVIANAGSVLIKRGEKIGIIAQGEEKSVISFSGKIDPHDLIILESPSFAQKLPPSQASEKLTGADVTEISENITPLVHENPEGSEAAILLQYVPIAEPSTEESSHEEAPITIHNVPTHHEEHEEPVVNTPQNEESALEEDHPSSAKPSFKLPSLKIPSFHNKKLLLIPLIIILILVFVGGLLLDKKKKVTQGNQEAVKTVLEPAQKKYDEAVALMSLNKSLAIDSLTEAKQELTSAQNKFSSDSDERKQVDALLSKVDEKLSEAGGGGSAKNQKTILESIKSPISVIARAGTLAVLDHDSGAVSEVSSDGSVSKTYTTDAKDAVQITADKTTYYVRGSDGVYSIEKKGKTGKKIFSPESASYEGIDTFLSNVYLLSSSDIEKYAPNAYAKASYLKDTKLSGTPVAFTIDSSIYVTFDDGTIKKYTKGKEDSFSVKGIPSGLGKALLIYTDPDIDNLYIYDKNNFRLVILSKAGEFQSQVETSALKNVSSLTVLESSKKAFVVADNKIISFEF